MARAEFEEKEFEVVANAELSSQGGVVLAPGQVMEKILGYDLSAQPHAYHQIWRILAVPRPPGLRLVPSLWEPGLQPPASNLPQVPVSLLVQYKRPEFIHGSRGRQWSLWHRPYYRFERTVGQHQVLRRLESQLGGDAIVRYASPAFWRRQDLEFAHFRRSVLAETGFVAPSTIGTHKIWTYVEPGTDGRPNPRGRPRPFESFEMLYSALISTVPPSSADLTVPGEPLFLHLGRLGEAARAREPRLRSVVTRWVADVQRTVPLPAELLSRLRDLASISSLVYREAVSWRVIDISPSTSS